MKPARAPTLRARRLPSLAFLVLLLSGVLLPATAGASEADPWEGFNRKTYAVNDALDRVVLKPTAKAYQAVVPKPLRTGVRNFFSNLNEPRTVANQVLQGKVGTGLSDGGRFLLNTTVGIGGLFDVATRFGLPRHQEDFGQTLGVWGVGSGPYLVIPGRGPSTVRDAVGMGVDTIFNPLLLLNDSQTTFALVATDIVSLRADLLAAEDLITGDAYVFLREAYLQRRDFDVSDGEIEDDPFLDDFDDDF